MTLVVRCASPEQTNASKADRPLWVKMHDPATGSRPTR